MTKHFSGSVFAVLWLLVAAAVATAYAAGVISVGGLVFLEVCALALGVVAMIFWKRMTQPSEIMEQVLYEADHPKR